MKRYAEGAFRSFGVPIQIRLGLNSGEVVVRAIGSDLHMDYTAVGQTTHLAARMEQMALPGAILLTPDTLALAEGFVQVISRGPVPVKGFLVPIENVRAGRREPRAQPAARRRVPRPDPLRRSRRRARSTAADAGPSGRRPRPDRAVVGEPGVGKSRLVWELASQPRVVLEAASVSYGKATTYFPVIELLRRYFGIEPRDDGRKIREKATGKLFTLDRSLGPALPALLALLDAPPRTPSGRSSIRPNAASEPSTPSNVSCSARAKRGPCS